MAPMARTWARPSAPVEAMTGVTSRRSCLSAAETKYAHALMCRIGCRHWVMNPSMIEVHWSMPTGHRAGDAAGGLGT